MKQELEVTRQQPGSIHKISWHDVLEVHEAAKLFPPLPGAELRVLGEDIQRKGLLTPIVLYGDRPCVLDGVNRLDAMELVGLEVVVADDNDPERYGLNLKLIPVTHYYGNDPFQFVTSINIHRRHLNSEQKRVLAGRILIAQSEKSDRTIAAMIKVDHHTVAAVRARMEATGEIPQTEIRTGKDGRYRLRPLRERAADKQIVLFPDEDVSLGKILAARNGYLGLLLLMTPEERAAELNEFESRLAHALEATKEPEEVAP